MLLRAERRCQTSKMATRGSEFVQKVARAVAVVTGMQQSKDARAVWTTSKF